MGKLLLGVLLVVCLAVWSASPPPVWGQEADDDVENVRLGGNVDFLITVSSSILALCLFVVSVMSYAYNRRGRMLFVVAAFFLFAFKGVLVAVDDASTAGLLSGQVLLWFAPFADALKHLSRLLDLGVLLLFFFGLIKK